MNVQAIRITLLSTIFALLISPLALAEGTTPNQIPGTTHISAEELIELVEEFDELVIIDARKSGEWEKGHVEDSIALPNTETDESALAKVLSSKETPVVFYCNGVKCGRSVESAKMAVSFGYKKIYWFRGGWEEWTAKGLPIAK